MRLKFPYRSSAAVRPRMRLRAAAAAAVEPLEPRCLLAAVPPPANVVLTTDPDVQQQPSVAVDPSATNHVVTVYTDRSLVNTGFAGLGVARSVDGGQTWTHSAIPIPAGYAQGAANPIAKFDEHGRVYVAFMAATFTDPKPNLTDPSFDPLTGEPYYAYGFRSTNGIFVARSDDGGMTWSQPVAVASNVFDGADEVPFEKKPDIAIDVYPILPDGRANPNYGNVYVVWARYYPAGQFPGEPDSTGGSSIQVAVSGDRGDSYALRLGPADAEHPVPISPIHDLIYSGIGPPPGLGGASWPHVIVGPNGDVYTGIFDFSGFSVSRSTDAGLTFAQADYDGERGFVFARPQSNIAAPTAPQAAGLDAKFRTQVVRNIAVDPHRPGTLYAIESVDNFDAAGNLLDDSDVLFARSTDFGVTWNGTVRLNPTINATVLNDDNTGLRASLADSDVTARQFFPRMAIDDGGNLVVTWYDTRRDPGNKHIDVFATVSTDGGESFSPNFRLTEQTFDPDAGRFTNAIGKEDYHLGDFLGLTIAGGIAHAAWTDTRGGNQDIVYASFPIAAPPPAPNDQFEPNDIAAVATDLGTVIQRHLPRLHVEADDVDLFHFTSPATGTIDVSAAQPNVGSRLNMELLDAASGTVLTTGTDTNDTAGAVTGQSIRFAGIAGREYVVRITPLAGGAAEYALDLQALTADLGTVVYQNFAGHLETGDQGVYLLRAAAAGSLQVKLTPTSDLGADVTLDILNADTLSPLASISTRSAEQAAEIDVAPGQAVLIRLTAASAGALAAGDFVIELSNLDAFASTARGGTLSFPAGNGPGQLVMADLNRDAKPDLVVSNVLSDTVSVLLGNGDGTFQAPRQFAIGAFVAGIETSLSVLHNGRGVAVADFDLDGNPDIAVTNKDSADVSVLLGRGDGTFAPQRRFDATSKPWSIDAGDLNGDGIPDLAVIDDHVDRPLSLALLFGRGDGTFRHEERLPTNSPGAAGVARVRIADVNGDGLNDILHSGNLDQKTHVLLGNGDGTFLDVGTAGGGSPGLTTSDLDGDGDLDLLSASIYTNTISYALGNGDGTFAPAETFFGGQSPVSVDVADIASVDPEDETAVLGTPDGIPDIISVGSGASQTAFFGPPEVMVAAGMFANGKLFYTPALRVAKANEPLSVATGDVNGDGAVDVAFIERSGVSLFFTRTPDFGTNTTRDAARDLGNVLHVLQQTLTIVPGRSDAWYSLTAPTEAARGSGDQVIDIAALFAHENDAGLGLEVLDASGNVLGSGKHVRARAAQGQSLYIHVFGKTSADGSRGSGAYTLDVTVLPQLVSVESHYLLPAANVLPAGPTTSLVLTFQGDRLNQVAAEDPGNYRVTHLGPDGTFGGGDDRVLALADSLTQPVVYNLSTNVGVSTGAQYPMASRQTITLLFGQALPAGAYRVEVSPDVTAADFNETEPVLLGDVRHSIVTVRGSEITSGADLTAAGLVRRPRRGAEVDLATFRAGTPYLSQLHGDLSALLDHHLSDAGDRAAITGELLAQLLGRLRSGLPAGGTMLALFLDPVGIDFVDPGGARLRYDLKSGGYENQIDNAFVSVAGNVELVVVPFAGGQFTLNIEDVPATARGGAVILDDSGGSLDELVLLTDRIRAGERTFVLDVDSTASLGGSDSDLLAGPVPSSLLDVTLTVAQHADVAGSGDTEFLASSDVGVFATAIGLTSAADLATSAPVTTAITATRGRDAPLGDVGGAARAKLKEAEDRLKEFIDGLIPLGPRAASDPPTGLNGAFPVTMTARHNAGKAAPMSGGQSDSVPRPVSPSTDVERGRPSVQPEEEDVGSSVPCSDHDLVPPPAPTPAAAAPSWALFIRPIVHRVIGRRRFRRFVRGRS